MDNKKNIAISDNGLRNVKRVAIELDLKLYETLDLILLGDKKAIEFLRKVNK